VVALGRTKPGIDQFLTLMLSGKPRPKGLANIPNTKGIHPTTDARLKEIDTRLAALYTTSATAFSSFYLLPGTATDVASTFNALDVARATRTIIHVNNLTATQLTTPRFIVENSLSICGTMSRNSEDHTESDKG